MKKSLLDSIIDEDFVEDKATGAGLFKSASIASNVDNKEVDKLIVDMESSSMEKYAGEELAQALASDLAEASRGSDNKHLNFIKEACDKGFTPTQIADLMVKVATVYYNSEMKKIDRKVRELCQESASQQ